MIHIPLDLVVGDFRVYLRGRDMLVTEHLRYRLDRNALRQADRRGERVPRNMRGQIGCNPCPPGYRSQRPDRRTTAFDRKNSLARLREATVSLYQFPRDGQQLHLELRTRFLPSVDNPHIPVGVCMQIVVGQLLYVRIGQTYERTEYEDVSDDNRFIVRQVYFHDLAYLVLVQKAPFAGLRCNPYVRKRVDGYPTFVEGHVNHSMQFF